MFAIASVSPQHDSDPSLPTPAPAFNSLDTCPEVTRQVTLARQAPRQRIQARRKGGMRHGLESGAAQRQAVRNLLDRTANNTKAEADVPAT